ncbi:uncharacterized protein YjlB [Rhodopseudomonas rhenobacensis]|uniref:Uncharacterized protein YjlB n=1 Tax=Rhodopseudomonas rhenobacensis TaxID=87461 RepID=A0A7W7Z5H6_9BRAD|nr:hypothetical protein [Rhodopseudomonas rhenobacensis]MBB5048397.1 uncharacterized protein YjlB [Rhodopseudomonas rhenobacensis]
MSETRDHIKPQTFVFEDDGLVPNNVLPLVIYKRAIEVTRADPAQSIEDVFERNGWGQRWRDGIYDFQHYHATVHEALGVARGHALVLFGGERGEAVQLGVGDVAILPAGTGHKCLFASHDFQVVGAYPPGDTMQITRPTPDNHRRAKQTIPQVQRPASDPLLGESGPLMRLWR